MDRGTINVPHLLAQYLFRHAEERKSGARLSGWHFIGRLAMHFGLVSDDGLRGLQVVTRELSLIDLHEIGRLHICTRYGDTWTWVAQGPERQQATAAGALEADEADQEAEEAASEIPAPAPAQAPPPPLPAPQPRTMSQRIERLEEELMDASGQTYQPFGSTLVGKLREKKGYDRFQKLLSQLDALGAGVSDEDANHKFLMSLPPAWDSLAMTMRTKKNIDTLSIDDLYNNLSVLPALAVLITRASQSRQE
ncbi:hypothetical protein Tco_1530980 [Tanacetum coccineum]